MWRTAENIQANQLIHTSNIARKEGYNFYNCLGRVRLGRVTDPERYRRHEPKKPTDQETGRQTERHRDWERQMHATKSMTE